MNIETRDKRPETAELTVAAPATSISSQPEAREAPLSESRTSPVRSEEEQLAPLFSPDAAKGFRADWDAIQISFVDDPKDAVRKADELVAQVMKCLAQTFSDQRARLEVRSDQADEATTENLRVALRHYRSFFQRLLSL